MREALVRNEIRSDVHRLSAVFLAAVYFLTHHHLLDSPARFDVLAVSWPADCSEPVIEHYRNAFEAVGRFQIYS